MAESLRTGSVRSGVFNVGGDGVSVLQMLDAVHRVTGRPVRRRVVDRRPGDPARVVADPSAIAAAIGWRGKAGCGRTSSGVRGRPTGPAHERVRTHPSSATRGRESGTMEGSGASARQARDVAKGRIPMGDHTSRRPARERSRLGPQVLTPPVGMAAVPDEVRATPSPRAPRAGSGTGRDLAASRLDDGGQPLPLWSSEAGARPLPRAGTDCGICGRSTCASYRVQGGTLRRLLRRIGLISR